MSFDPDTAASQLRDFLSTQVSVLVMEHDEVLLRLEPGDACGYSIQAEPRRLIVHWWSPERNLVRRVESIEARPPRLRLMARRLGQTQLTPLWLAPGSQLAPRTRERQEFRRRLLGKLRQCWPEWEPITGDSPVHGAPWQHLALRRGQQHLLCLALSPDEPSTLCEQALTHLLLWQDEWRRRHPRALPPKTRLLLPAGGARAAALRREGLRAERRPEIYWLDDACSPQIAEPLPLSALASGIARAPAPAWEPPAEALQLFSRLRALCPAAQLTRGAFGGASFRLHGLEFLRPARAEERAHAAFVFGYGREFSPLNETNWPLFEAWLRELASLRRPGGSASSIWYAAQPEAWLEESLRGQLPALAPDWDTQRLYSQVSLNAAEDAMRLDLLFCHRDGRLGIAEFKTGEDLHFALQALDYWLRVRQQQLGGELFRQGYFADREISNLPPRLYLIAPALYRHPKLEALLAAFAPEIPVEQWLLNADWRERAQVLERRKDDAISDEIGSAPLSLESSRP